MVRVVAAVAAAALSIAGAHADPLRVGLVEAPNAGVLFVGRGQNGAPQGVTVDLGADLAKSMGRPFSFAVFPNTGAATEALQSRAIDVTFMPVDETRRQLVAFGPGYYQLESTYLVSGASGIADVAEVDRPGLRVVAIAGTTTIRASARTLKATQPVAVPSVAEGLDRMRSGQADALALSRDSLLPFVAQVPGSRIVRGGFQQTMVAIAVSKGEPEMLASVTAWMDAAKANGLVRRVFDAHRLTTEVVAP